jgi:flagellar biosynthesis protein FliR
MFTHYNDQQTLKFLFVLGLVIAVSLVCVWLFYKLIYGLLIKKLNKNYKELKAIE